LDGFVAPAGGVMLIEAPAGFGKTSLLVDWRGRLHAEDWGTAWFTFDETDSPQTALQYLFFALREAGLECSPAEDGVIALEVQKLLAAIERSGRQWLLVLDNLTSSAAEIADGLLAPLFRFMPGNLSVALASDGRLRLPVSDLARRGFLRRLSADMLLFDRSDLRAIAGRAVTDHQIRVILRKSGGWPVLAQIMIADRMGSVLQQEQDSGPIGAFLHDRLLSALGHEERELLSRLAHLKRFSEPFLDQLMHGRATDGLLAELLERRLVCRVPADEGLDLVVHPAFVGLLAGASDALTENAVLDFQRKAAEAHLEMGQFVHATGIAVAIGDEPLIAEIIEACNPLRLWFELGLGPLRRIVNLLPAELRWRHPRIGYACITCWSKTGQLKESSDLFTKIEGELSGIDIRSLPPALRIERAMCRSLLAIYQGTPLTMADVEELEGFTMEFPDLAPLIMSAAGTMRGYVLQMESAFDAAAKAARKAIVHAEDVQSQYAALFLHCDIGMIAGLKGRVAEAEAAFHEGDRACNAALRDDERLTMIRDAFRLELHHELSPEDETALPRLRNICRRLPRLEGWPDVFAAAFRTYSEKLVFTGSDEAALTLIDTGIDYARREDVRSLAHILGHHRALLLVLMGKHEEARRALASLAAEDLLAPSVMPWRAYEARVEAMAAIAFHSGNADAQAMLEEASEWAREHGNLRSELRFRSFQASMGLGGEAARKAMIAQSGFSRSVLLIERMRRSGLNGKPHPSGATFETAGSAFFTPRELSVLERVERGLSDKAIALELGITPHGVRYHLKRIYAQLGVHTREQASRKAKGAARSTGPY
jgi:LuxR family maltose regulon positive regulatory protein